MSLPPRRSSRSKRTLIRSAHHSGRLLLAQEAARLAYWRSARTRARQRGGQIAQALYDYTAQPRDGGGRFATAISGPTATGRRKSDERENAVGSMADRGRRAPSPATHTEPRSR